MKTFKSAFEINWPLVGLGMSLPSSPPMIIICGFHSSFWCAENDFYKFDGLSSPLLREIMFSGPILVLCTVIKSIHIMSMDFIMIYFAHITHVHRKSQGLFRLEFFDSLYTSSFTLSHIFMIFSVSYWSVNCRFFMVGNIYITGSASVL